MWRIDIQILEWKSVKYHVLPFHKSFHMCAHFQSMRWQMDKAGLLDVLCLQLLVELGNPAILSYEPGIQTKDTGLSFF